MNQEEFNKNVNRLVDRYLADIQELRVNLRNKEASLSRLRQLININDDTSFITDLQFIMGTDKIVTRDLSNVMLNSETGSYELTNKQQEPESKPELETEFDGEISPELFAASIDVVMQTISSAKVGPITISDLIEMLELHDIVLPQIKEYTSTEILAEMLRSVNLIPEDNEDYYNINCVKVANNYVNRQEQFRKNINSL